MKREDGRKLSKDALEERRKIIVRMRKRGKTLREIKETVQLSRTTICKTLKNYREHGHKALPERNAVEEWELCGILQVIRKK